MKTLKELRDLAKKKGAKRIVVAGAQEKDTILAIEEARKLGFAKGILIGDTKEIKSLARELDIPIGEYEVIEEEDIKATARRAALLIREGKADILMKGLISTSYFMKAVLDKEKGLCAGGLLSHIAVFEVPAYHKLLIVTDAAINIAPTLDEKMKLIDNAVQGAHAIGIDTPKVACVGAVEKVNPKMQATTDAAVLASMNRRGQIKGCVVDGPFGFDNAVSEKSANTKKIVSPVAGDADIILCPEIETANVLYKSLLYFGGATCAAIVVGTIAPVVLTSRADPEETKFSSIALGVLLSHQMG